jgi:DNA-binding transcriptional regulator YiaG
MTIAIPDSTRDDKVVDLVDRLRANRLPPPSERRAIRRRARASLDDLAAALGVQKMTVSRWERGVAQPWPKHRAAYIGLLQALADVGRELEAQVRK